jgi:hypothetical protein
MTRRTTTNRNPDKPASITRRNKPYPGALTLPTPDIGFVGNIIRKFPGTRSIVELIKIKKINQALAKATTESMDIASNLLKTKPILDNINGIDHPMFQCIDKVIGRIPDHSSKKIFDEIKELMTDYNKTLDGKTFLTYLFKKIVIDSNEPSNKGDYLHQTHGIEFFKDLVDKVDLERKDVVRGEKTMNILDYVLHPNYNISPKVRKDYLYALLSKKSNLECSNINALFSLTMYTKERNYSGFDLINEVVSVLGENVNVYRTDLGDFIENHGFLESAQTTRHKVDPMIYFNIYVNKFIPANEHVNDIKLDELNPAKAGSIIFTPIIHLLEMILTIDNKKTSGRINEEESKSDEFVKEKCIYSISVMLQVASESHLKLMYKYMTHMGMQNNILKHKHIKDIFYIKMKGFMKYPISHECSELMNGIAKLTDYPCTKSQNVNPQNNKVAAPPIVPPVGAPVGAAVGGAVGGAAHGARKQIKIPGNLTKLTAIEQPDFIRLVDIHNNAEKPLSHKQKTRLNPLLVKLGMPVVKP